MLIKCENCSITYEVPEERLISEHPEFLRCTHCGFVFKAPVLQDAPGIEPPIAEEERRVPSVAQSDTEPMALADIFTPLSEEDAEASQEADMSVGVHETPMMVEPEVLTPFNESDENTSSHADEHLFTPIDESDVFAPVAPEKETVLRWWMGVAAFVVTVLLLSYLAYVGRYYFVRRAPSTEALYQKAGISTTVLGSGLLFQNTMFDIEQQNDVYMLVVQSQLKNTNANVAEVPPVVVRVLDDAGQVIQSETAVIPATSIGGGEMIPFEVRLVPVLSPARKVEITFERAAS